ncbi:hypothetical protein ACET3Z_002792 [Daucus carota]
MTMTDHIGVDSAEVDGDDGDVVAYGDGELDASDVGGGVVTFLLLSPSECSFHGHISKIRLPTPPCRLHRNKPDI